MIDRVVAVVNGDVIMMSELQEAIVLSRRDGRGLPPDGPELERTVLNRLVDHRLQVQEAKREKIEVTEDELRTDARRLREAERRRPGEDRGPAPVAGGDVGGPAPGAP